MLSMGLHLNGRKWAKKKQHVQFWCYKEVCNQDLCYKDLGCITGGTKSAVCPVLFGKRK